MQVARHRSKRMCADFWRRLHPAVAFIGFLFGASAAALLGHTWPLWAWPLAQPWGVIAGGLVGVSGARLFVIHLLEGREEGDPAKARSILAWGWLPLVLPLAQFYFPHVDLIRDWALLLGGVLLTAGLLLQWLRTAKIIAFPDWVFPLAATLAAGVVYLLTMGRHVGAADTFEFQVTAYSLGIAHPTGYPLYVMLGHLFIKLLPVGSVAWRMNLTAVIPASLVVGGLVWLAQKSGAEGLDAFIAAMMLAFSLTFWQAATAAEVYALNALLVLGILFALHRLITKREDHRALYLLFLMVGLGLAHHLTISLTLPSILLTLVVIRPRASLRQWSVAGLLLLLGIMPVLYIPLRWPAITGDMMSWREFLSYVTARQFAGSLQWQPIFQPERWRILGRIIVAQFGVVGLALSLFGLGVLLWRKSFWAIVTLVMAGAYLCYGAAYNVPDVAVFLIPAFLLMAFWIALGVMQFGRWLNGRYLLYGALFSALALLPLASLTTNWNVVDRSGDDGGEAWARQVFAAVADDAVILADSLRIAPLEYLHRVEDLGPDMTITVQGDEAGYRQVMYESLDARRHVYLARTLPGLEGAFYLRSAGPVVEVSRQPLTNLPANFRALNVKFGDSLILAGVKLADGPWREGEMLPITLAWQRMAAPVGRYEVRLRLRSLTSDTIVWQENGFAANGFYPTNAWKPDEVVLDYHETHLAYGWAWEGDYALEAGLFEPFATTGAPTPDGSEWAELGVIKIEPGAPPRRCIREDIALDASLLLVGYDAPDKLYATRGSDLLTLYLLARKDGTYALPLRIDSADGVVNKMLEIGALHRGDYRAIPLHFELPQTAGPMTVSLSDNAIVTIDVRELPAKLANFTGVFALDAAELKNKTASPGDVISVSAQWTTLTRPDEDYTIFVQAIGPDGALHGQIDTYPLQGTLPTSLWPEGETIQDSYQFPLHPDAPPGQYQIIIGFYLLRTGERLPVLNALGQPIGDAYTIGVLQVH